MARSKKKAAPTANHARISAERASRLYHLLNVLADGTKSRPQILKKLGVGMRTFYRDLDLLRERGIDIVASGDGYDLRTGLQDALGHVPFPDPELTFGEVMTLMKGRTKSHMRLKQAFEEVAK